MMTQIAGHESQETVSSSANDARDIIINDCNRGKFDLAPKEEAQLVLWLQFAVSGKIDFHTALSRWLLLAGQLGAPNPYEIINWFPQLHCLLTFLRVLQRYTLPSDHYCLNHAGKSIHIIGVRITRYLFIFQGHEIPVSHHSHDLYAKNLGTMHNGEALPLPPAKGLPVKINYYEDVDEPRYTLVNSNIPDDDQKSR